MKGSHIKWFFWLQFPNFFSKACHFIFTIWCSSFFILLAILRCFVVMPWFFWLYYSFFFDFSKTSASPNCCLCSWVLYIISNLFNFFLYCVFFVSQGSLSFMEGSGLSQPLIPSKPLAPTAEVINIIINYVSLEESVGNFQGFPFQIKLQLTWAKQVEMYTCMEQTRVLVDAAPSRLIDCQKLLTTFFVETRSVKQYLSGYMPESSHDHDGN